MPAQPSQYLLGRNSNFVLQKVDSVANGLTGATGGYSATPGPSINICVMTGSIDLTANVISIINNCNYGWEVKLPGMKTGTVTLTGHITSAAGATNYEIFTSHGTLVNFTATAADSNGITGLNFTGQGTVTGSRVSVDINEAVTVELTIELAGAPSTISFGRLAAL